MNPEDDRRVTRLEEHDKAQDERFRVIEAKLDELLKLAAVGQGAFWAILKVGGLCVALLGAVAAFVTIVEKFLSISKPH